MVSIFDCGFYVGLTFPCWTVVSMLDYGFHVGLWLPYWTVTFLLDCAFHIGSWLSYWTVASILDCGFHFGLLASLLDCGFHIGLRVPCWSVASILDYGFPVGLWLPYWAVTSILTWISLEITRALFNPVNSPSLVSIALHLHTYLDSLSPQTACILAKSHPSSSLTLLHVLFCLHSYLHHFDQPWCPSGRDSVWVFIIEQGRKRAEEEKCKEFFCQEARVLAGFKATHSCSHEPDARGVGQGAVKPFAPFSFYIWSTGPYGLSWTFCG